MSISYSPKISLKYNQSGSIVNSKPETIPKRFERNFVYELFLHFLKSALHTSNSLIPLLNLQSFTFPLLHRIIIRWKFYSKKTILKRRLQLIHMKSSWSFEEFGCAHAECSLKWRSQKQVNPLIVDFETLSSKLLSFCILSKTLELNRGE